MGLKVNCIPKRNETHSMNQINLSIYCKFLYLYLICITFLHFIYEKNIEIIFMLIFKLHFISILSYT